LDFIEKLFGVSPDGGNGLWELGIIVTIAVVLSLRPVRRDLKRLIVR
jgi:hypothetical protein